jgi:hypothetical protein
MKQAHEIWLLFSASMKRMTHHPVVAMLAQDVCMPIVEGGMPEKAIPPHGLYIVREIVFIKRAGNAPALEEPPIYVPVVMLESVLFL